MSVPAAYLGIILIWSTTPLAIQWSSQGTSYAFAVLARMLIGVTVAFLLLRLGRIPFPLHARARRAYLVGGLSVFGAMALTYWGARHIHSGLISVLFGLSPLVAAVLGALLCGEKSLTRSRLLGLALALFGLASIFFDAGLADAQAGIGLAAVLLGVFIYAGSLVWLKQIGDDSPPLATTVASLTVSLPLFALLWLLDGEGLPAALPMRTLAAIAYLGVFGSVIGFALYYYVIQRLDAARVALITLITPVMALWLGGALNGETPGLRVWIGSLIILSGLLLHQSSFLFAAGGAWKWPRKGG